MTPGLGGTGTNCTELGLQPPTPRSTGQTLAADTGPVHPSTHPGEPSGTDAATPDGTSRWINPEDLIPDKNDGVDRRPGQLALQTATAGRGRPRLALLIWSICRRYRRGGADAEDVSQAVWLQLVDHLGGKSSDRSCAGPLAGHHDPPGMHRARRRTRGPHAAWSPLNTESIPDQQTPVAEQELLEAERHAALRQAFTRLPGCCQQLIALLTDDQLPMPDAQDQGQR